MSPYMQAHTHTHAHMYPIDVENCKMWTLIYKGKCLQRQKWENPRHLRVRVSMGRF